MTIYLATVATVATITSVIRLVVAVADYRRKWVVLPSRKVFNIPGKKG